MLWPRWATQSKAEYTVLRVTSCCNLARDEIRSFEDLSFEPSSRRLHPETQGRSQADLNSSELGCLCSACGMCRCSRRAEAFRQELKMTTK